MAQSTYINRFHHQARPTSWLSRLLLAHDLRKQRLNLRHMSDAQLADIGITRAQAEAEARRTVWDAPAHWRR